MMNYAKAAILYACLALWSPAVVTAAGEDQNALVTKAKEEKTLVIYSTMELKDGIALAEAFQKKYLSVEAKLLRLGSTQMSVKVLQEHRAGSHLFDVTQVGDFVFYELFRAGLFQAYVSPERRAFAEDFKDKQGFWTSAYHNAGVIAYNTNVVKPDDVPKSIDDLLQPKWKGKMLMDSNGPEWYAAMVQILGQEKGLRFMRSLASQDLNFRPSRNLITEILTSGVFGLAVNNYYHLVQSAKERGAPVESVAAYPVISRVHTIALGRYAPHPNVGKLYIDFVLSEEGQKILRSFDRSSSRKGIEPDELQKKGVKLYVTDLNLGKNYANYMKEFREIFGIK
jgi:iron(III) transport system substrate-binding protein